MDIIQKYITPQREADLINSIKAKMLTIGQKSGPGRSRILRYGWDYEGKNWMGDIPEEFARPGANSVTINEYAPGRGIGPHVDSLRFADTIEILSLGSDAEIWFTKPDDQRSPVRYQLYARSLFRLNGEFRYQWQHHVPAVQHKRWSIVYRRKL